MPALIVQQGDINLAALGAPAAVVQVIPPTQPIVGAQTNILAEVGAATWGPVNIATVVGGNDDFRALFGSRQNRKYDLSTAIAVAVQNFQSSFKVVRVTDATDTAATGTYASSETFATETVAGTIHTGDVLTLTFTPTSGSPTVVTYTLTASETTATLAAVKLAAAINANATIAAAGFFANNAAGVVNLYCPGGVAPGTGWTSVTPSVTGGGATTTLTGATSTASTTKLTLTGLYTGTEGNNLKPTVQPGTAVNSTKIVIGRPGYVPEVFDNIVGTGNLMWVNAAAAINNGNGALRGPSQLCIATAGVGGQGAPVASSAVAMAGGTDGYTGIVDSTVLGTDTAPRKGLYALRNQGCSVANLVDYSSSTGWTSMMSFALSEGVYIHTSTPVGDTITTAATELSGAGVDNYGLHVYFGDWLYWWDDVNVVQRLLAPATFGAAKRAVKSPQQSILNKKIYGIIGSQKTLTGGVWAKADIDALYAARLELIANPAPGGSYWAAVCGVNASSNAAANGDNYTSLTNFIARSVANWAGSNIGPLQTPTQRQQAVAVANNFFQGLWELGMIGNANSANGVGTPPWSVAINDITTPPALAAAGYEICAVQVQYLAVIRWFILSLQAGQTVLAVSANASSFTGNNQ